jgi:hypothetical protein
MPTATELYEYYKDEHVAVDGIEPLIISPRNPNLPDIPGVQGRQINVDLSSLGIFGANVALEEIDAIFIVWDSTLNGRPLRSGFLLTDSVSRYIITNARRHHFNTQWWCTCRRQVDL